MALRTVAIVGRPNVGKSTLFNRVIGERRSVVHETPGVTRDRIAERADWGEHAFLLVDTGGIIPYHDGETDARFDRLVTDISLETVRMSDLVIFLTDGRTGSTSWDEHIARELRKSRKPVILAVNKLERESDRLGLSEFYNLGLGEPLGISAAHGFGVCSRSG